MPVQPPAAPVEPPLDQMEMLDITDGDINDVPSLHAQMMELKASLTEQICLLRLEVETLKRGGWRMSVGPFQQVLRPEPSRVHATRDRANGGLTGEAHKALSSSSL
jgi:hypothetical protein